jgi:hypothetical protein
MVKRATKPIKSKKASAARRPRTRFRTLRNAESDKLVFVMPTATPEPRVHRVSGMQEPGKTAGWLGGLVATRRRASRKKKNWIVCLLCEETVRAGELLAHKRAFHDVGSGSTKTARRKKKPLRVTIVSGGLPTLGKRR